MDDLRRREIEEEEVYRAQVRARLATSGPPAPPGKSQRASSSQGLSSVERAAGTYGALHDPITTAMVAGDLLENETDPERREALRKLRDRSNLVLMLQIALAVLLLGAFATFCVSNMSSSKAREACMQSVFNRNIGRTSNFESAEKCNDL